MQAKYFCFIGVGQLHVLSVCFAAREWVPARPFTMAILTGSVYSQSALADRTICEGVRRLGGGVFREGSWRLLHKL